MQKKEEAKPCPLCGTMLPYDKWLKVVGVYEEQQKYKKQLESELVRAKENSLKLKNQHRMLLEQEKNMRTRLTQERKKMRQISKDLKEKEKNLRASLQQQFSVRQAKLEEKFERAKKIALGKVRKEGIRIGSEKAKASTAKLKDALDKLRQERALAETKLKSKFQEDMGRLKNKLDRERRRELKRVQIEAMKAGGEKQKAKTVKVNQMLEKTRKARDEAIERAKQLEEMLKKGTTPQIEGLDFEKELANQLRTKFPEDEVKPTGHKGDIIQTVRAQNKKIGRIIYECKKTRTFVNTFIKQIRRDKAKATADYGVLVTWATKEDKQGFWVEGDIIVVHPYGVLDIAVFLRETIVQMYALRSSGREVETKGRALLEFMQSEDFRAMIQSSIAKSREAFEILNREYKSHINTWKRRFKIYGEIYRNTAVIQDTVRYVLLHGKVPEKLPEPKQLPALPLLVSTRTGEPPG
jgi:hypothetical protein